MTLVVAAAAAVAAGGRLEAAPPAGQAQGGAPLRLEGLSGGEKLRTLVEAVVVSQRSVHSLRADFTQMKRSALLLEPVESRGEFSFRAPATVRWDYALPEKMVVLLADDLLT